MKYVGLGGYCDCGRVHDDGIFTLLGLWLLRTQE
jgi:hypothetical protein